MSSHYGLRLLPGLLDSILHDRHQYMPQDTYHAVAGKTFIYDVRYLSLLMILPFILKQLLTIGDIKSAFLNETKARSSGYYQLQETLDKELNVLIELFPNSFQHLPNLHINRHLVDHARRYATCWCIDNSNFSIHASQECAQDNDNLTDISSFSHFNCSEIKLGSKWGKQEIENTGFVSNDLEASGLLASIMNSNGNFQDVIFCVGEAVETTLSNDGQPAFGVVKGIIKHKWNVE
ncbi:hypothetical protein C2G38_2201036 [Gigaspora rosea]|uniref:Uncharacterized protein n=1 Tax=Gigaspora rosea TaxID=44941 RepID=A0A397UQ02_9GLOM|nr:hypothetical protein C2G38_2201036 [Gigaspora rosea]